MSQENIKEDNEESRGLKRPSLFIIRGILDNVDRAAGHRARFSDLARGTPELRNRAKLTEYLDLLVHDLQWLDRKDEAQITRLNPFANHFRERRWTVSWYTLTYKGKAFLGLFPTPRVLPDEEFPRVGE